MQVDVVPGRQRKRVTRFVAGANELLGPPTLDASAPSRCRFEAQPQSCLWYSVIAAAGSPPAGGSQRMSRPSRRASAFVSLPSRRSVRARRSRAARCRGSGTVRWRYPRRSIEVERAARLRSQTRPGRRAPARSRSRSRTSSRAKSTGAGIRRAARVLPRQRRTLATNRRARRRAAVSSGRQRKLEADGARPPERHRSRGRRPRTFPRAAGSRPARRSRRAGGTSAGSRARRRYREDRPDRQREDRERDGDDPPRERPPARARACASRSGSGGNSSSRPSPCSRCSSELTRPPPGLTQAARARARGAT